MAEQNWLFFFLSYIIFKTVGALALAGKNRFERALSSCSGIYLCDSTKHNGLVTQEYSKVWVRLRMVGRHLQSDPFLKVKNCFSCCRITAKFGCAWRWQVCNPLESLPIILTFRRSRRWKNFENVQRPPRRSLLKEIGKSWPRTKQTWSRGPFHKTLLAL